MFDFKDNGKHSSTDLFGVHLAFSAGCPLAWYRFGGVWILDRVTAIALRDSALEQTLKRMMGVLKTQQVNDESARALWQAF